jgi:YebC/PmpR family DNA-binding regulatory protein
MSGHSKWATTKRKKAVIDSARGKVFTKIIKEITVAAREGGGNIDANARLRSVVTKAKESNMPAENIKRAIQRGTGELPGVTYEEVMYEGYGSGGVAVIVKGLTDNKNRAASEIRSIFTKHGGNMGESGCVAWLFQKKGFLAIDKVKASEDEVMSIALDAGALDISTEESTYDITTAPEDMEKVKEAFNSKGITPSVAEVTQVPSNYIKLEGKEAEQVLNLVEALEDNDDVQDVYANFDISDEIMEARAK